MVTEGAPVAPAEEVGIVATPVRGAGAAARAAVCVAAAAELAEVWAAAESAGQFGAPEVGARAAGGRLDREPRGGDTRWVRRPARRRADTVPDGGDQRRGLNALGKRRSWSGIIAPSSVPKTRA